MVSLTPHNIAFAAGLAADVIVGDCTKLLEKSESVNHTNFRPNKRFVGLLHDVIATEAPKLPALQAEARRQHTGWIYLIDARTPTPDATIPPCDVIGALEVRHGTIVPGSYKANPNHLLFSSNGLFKLAPALQER